MTTTEARPVIPAAPDDAGCWLDNHRGVDEILALVVLEAHDRGGPDQDVRLAEWALEMIDRNRYGFRVPWGEARTRTLREFGFEFLVEAADRAEGWLTEHCAPAGYAFGFELGDWGLWRYCTECGEHNEPEDVWPPDQCRYCLPPRPTER